MLSTVSGDNAVRRSDTMHPAESLARIIFQTLGVNALGRKAIRQHRLCVHSWHLKSDPQACCKSLTHCMLPRVTAVDLIDHSELYGVNKLYEFSVLSNKYGP